MFSNPKNLRLLIAAIVLLIVVCLCVCLIGIVGVHQFGWFPPKGLLPPVTATSTAIAQSSQVTATSPRATPTSKPDFLLPPTSTPHPTSATNPPATLAATIAPDIIAQMEEIELDVSFLRGLEPNQPIVRGLMTSEQLRQHVIDDFLKDYTAEEARQDVITLAAFGLLSPDFEMHTFYVELLSEQIAGFYDNETKEMYVVQDEGFLGLQRMTYAHEFVHVLQDQHYDIKEGLKYSDEYCDHDQSERCAALQALIEGDASLVEIQWFSKFSTSEDQAQVTEFYQNYASPVYDSAPAFLQEDFLFPYDKGLSFVQHLQNNGGWQAVDDAYRNPPTSTEQILHPEKYPADTPLPVTLPDVSNVLGEGWQLVDEGTLGEWYTYLVLAKGQDENARMPLRQAQKASAGWGGDYYVVYYNDQKQATVLVLATLWDTLEDADQFVQVFGDFATARFGTPRAQQNDTTTWENGSSYTVLHQRGSQTTWILAPDGATADALWGVLQP